MKSETPTTNDAIAVYGHSGSVDGPYLIVHSYGDAERPHLVLQADGAMNADPGNMIVAEPSGELHLTYWVCGEEFTFDGQVNGRSVLRRVEDDAEDPHEKQVHDLAADLIEKVLECCPDVPEGGFAIDEIIRLDHRRIAVKFSGIDEAAEPPHRYFGILTYSPDDGWHGKWSADLTYPMEQYRTPETVTALVYYTLDPENSSLTIVVDSDDLNREAGPIIRQFRRSEWQDPCFDFVQREARRLVDEYDWPKCKVTVWDDAEERWIGENE